MNPGMFFLPLVLIYGMQSACVTNSNIKLIVETKFQPLLSKNLPKDKRRQSILVAVITPFETQIVPLGTLTDEGEVPNEKTIFEIGSITKGFLGLLLANENLKGTLDLGQSFELKTGFQLPNYGSQKITWRNLAQHTAALPRLPRNHAPENPMQPYLDYDVNHLLSFFKTYQLPIPPGVESHYSNVGAGLVGYGLELIHKKSLEGLLRVSFLDELGLTDTRIHLNTEQNSRLAPVFLNGENVELWQWTDSSVLQGAGALRSSLDDMIVALKALMGISAHQDLLPLVQLATTPNFNLSANDQLGLFWNFKKDQNVIWHNGGTYGTSSFLGYDPDRLVGIVVFSNSQLLNENTGVDSQIDTAAFETIAQISANINISKPLKILKDYDLEIARRESEFAKNPDDLKSKTWVKKKLAHMVDIDQWMRKFSMPPSEAGLTEHEISFYNHAFSKRFYLMDWKNTQDLKKLIQLHGWFKISDWGREADQNAWLLVQHADNEPEFQKHVLDKLTPLNEIKETDGRNYAYLIDRVLCSFKDPSQRKPQRYGTQGMCVGVGKWEPHPIEDAANVDRRRAEVGLPPMNEYKILFKDICR